MGVFAPLLHCNVSDQAIAPGQLPWRRPAPCCFQACSSAQACLLDHAQTEAIPCCQPATAVLQAYTDEGNQKQQPIMVHRAIFGSIERFFGILIENCAGAFPLWLAPVQCRIMPVTDAVLDYAQQVAAQMRQAGIRVQVDSGEQEHHCTQCKLQRGCQLRVVTR